VAGLCEVAQMLGVSSQRGWVRELLAGDPDFPQPIARLRAADLDHAGGRGRHRQRRRIEDAPAGKA